MIALFNELMDCFSLVVDALLNKLPFHGDISIGWMILAITCIGIVVSYLYGRLH